jgi:predicted phosphoribosyltransferase
MFRDRNEAGRRLAEELARYAGQEDAVVYGIPRGGVVVAAEIASRLDLPLDVVITTKVGAPDNPEYAVGAIDPDGNVIVNPMSGYTVAEVEHLGRSAREKIERRLDLYRGGRFGISPEGKVAIVVDDGIATGLTARAAVNYLRRQGASRIVLATPVIAADTARVIGEEADELIAVETPDIFYAVGQFYRHFDQTSDDEVLALLGGNAGE